MWHNDPIFKNFVYTSPYVIKAFSTVHHARVCKRWVDGVELFVLDRLAKERRLLMTNCRLVNQEQYQNHIYTVNHTFYGVFYCDYRVDETTPIQRKFNCFSNRFDITRQSWFYHLVRRNWLDLGYVSFNCEAQRNRIPDPSYRNLNSQEMFEKAFTENLTIFSKEHNQIKDQVPYKNFEETGDITNLVLQSGFSIVLETWFHGNHCVTFSEKIMRCLQLPRPWVLFTVQHGIQQLRDWGFDVLDDVVDHSYDSIEDAIQRQVAILDQCNKLMELNVQDVAERCKIASEHNKNILRDWNSQYFINMDQDFLAADQKASML